MVGELKTSAGPLICHNEEMEGAHGKDETFKHLEERWRATGSPSKPQLLFVVVKAT